MVYKHIFKIAVFVAVVIGLVLIWNRRRENMANDKNLIVLYPHEIINSNFKVYRNRAPIEITWPNFYLLARPIPTPTTRYMSPKDLLRDTAIRKTRCSMIVENPRKEMWGYNQYYPILLEFRQDYNTYVGYKPKTIKVDWLKFDYQIPKSFVKYTDYAPRYSLISGPGFFKSVPHAKKWCKKDVESIDTPCRNFVVNKKNGYIFTNKPGDVLYYSPGYDTYVAK